MESLNNNGSSSNVNTQHNHPPGSGIPAVTGDEDFRVLGYLPDEQDPSLGRAGTEVGLHQECIPRAFLTELSKAFRGNHKQAS